MIKAIRGVETKEIGDKNQRSGCWRIWGSEVSDCEIGDEASGAKVGFMATCKTGGHLTLYLIKVTDYLVPWEMDQQRHLEFV